MPIFPSGITPIARFDPTQPAFSDTAGTIPAVVGAQCARVNEASPLTNYWSTSGAKAVLDTASTVRLDYFGSGAAGPSMAHSVVAALTNNNCVLCVSFRTRDGGSGPAQGLFMATTPGVGFGLYAGGGTCALTYNGFNWAPSSVLFKAGQRVTFVAKVTSTGIKAWVIVDGTLYTDSLVATIAGNALNSPLTVGAQFGANNGIDGSVSVAVAAAVAPSDADALALALWADSLAVPVAFPTAAPLVAVCGDSIARNIPGASIYNAWCWKSIGAIRSGSFPTCEMVNAAASGAGAAGVINNALPYYSAARSRNVMVIAVGTNDLATGASAAATLATILAQYDSALAAGWRPLLATILDRTAALSVSQPTYNANRATVNAGILASGRNVIDLTGVAGLSANGASAGSDFIDGIHPGDSGHALMETVYRAAILPQLAATVPPSAPRRVANRGRVVLANSSGKILKPN